MIIILYLYLVALWAVFSKFKLVRWGWLSGTDSPLVGGFILATFLALFNYLTPSGRVTVTGRVVEVTPNVTGQIVAIPVKPNVPVKANDCCFKSTRRRFSTRSRSCRPRSPQRSSRSRRDSPTGSSPRSPACARDRCSTSTCPAPGAIRPMRRRLQPLRIRSLPRRRWLRPWASDNVPVAPSARRRLDSPGARRRPGERPCGLQRPRVVQPPWFGARRLHLARRRLHLARGPRLSEYLA
jgi:hypothetical protein